MNAKALQLQNGCSKGWQNICTLSELEGTDAMGQRAFISQTGKSPASWIKRETRSSPPILFFLCQVSPSLSCVVSFCCSAHCMQNEWKWLETPGALFTAGKRRNNSTGFSVRCMGPLVSQAPCPRQRGAAGEKRRRSPAIHYNAGQRAGNTVEGKRRDRRYMKGERWSREKRVSAETNFLIYTALPLWPRGRGIKGILYSCSSQTAWNNWAEGNGFKSVLSWVGTLYAINW